MRFSINHVVTLSKCRKAPARSLNSVVTVYTVKFVEFGLDLTGTVS